MFGYTLKFLYYMMYISKRLIKNTCYVVSQFWWDNAAIFQNLASNKTGSASQKMWIIGSAEFLKSKLYYKTYFQK